MTIAALLTLSAAGPAAASVIFYTDRASWLGAAGGTAFSEDFSGFTEDTSFQTSPVPLVGMTIEQVGSGDFRNKIDAADPDFEFTEHDGSSHASLFTNAPGGSTSAIQVRITFTQQNLAFGFDHWEAADSEGARLEIYNGVTLLGAQDLTNDFPGFLGYVLDGGDLATSVLFRSVESFVVPDDPGEGFGIDALQGVPVPEPGTAVLLALGLGLVAARRRR